jgi:signal-transduction protein with cAMP-binding, CBS, and nucleotidyltransferase domain
MRSGSGIGRIAGISIYLDWRWIFIFLLVTFSLEDVRKVPRDAWETSTVSQIMTRAGQLTVVTPQEYVSEALNRLERQNVLQAPVIQDGRLVGLLRRRDIMRWLQTQSELVTS